MYTLVKKISIFVFIKLSKLFITFKFGFGGILMDNLLKIIM